MAEKRYHEAVGRRKTASARVRIFPDAVKESFDINGRDIASYFPIQELRTIVEKAFQTATPSRKFAVTAKVRGGGIAAQAGALRHAIARALVSYEADLRQPLKKAGFLTRDARAKERKKPGLKGARRAAQWSKR